ncbi:MAG: biotin/lipoate A/B protein ligase family protein [Terriglobia bacterium]
MNDAEGKVWRLISDPPRRGALNMEIDDALLHHLEESDQVATVVRFYEWERPTLSLGQHQRVELAADLDFCRANQIDIVHRPTGGRAVLHDQELTYAVISNDQDVFASTSVLRTYKQIAQGLCRGLRRLGVEALLADAPTHALEAPQNPLTVKHPCFNSPSRYELMVGQRKLVGSAQKRLQRSFLQHGSLLLDCNIPVLARATRADEEALAQSITTLRKVLGRPAGRGEVEQVLLKGMEEEFSIHFEVQPLTEGELMRMFNSKNKIFHGVSA